MIEADRHYGILNLRVRNRLPETAELHGGLFYAGGSHLDYPGCTVEKDGMRYVSLGQKAQLLRETARRSIISRTVPDALKATIVQMSR